MKDYRALKLKRDNIDTYFPLSKKVKLVKDICKSYFRGELIDIGCGEMPYKGLVLEESEVKSYVGVDIKNESYQQLLKPDLFWDGKTLPVDDNTFDCGMLIEVLEHVHEPRTVLKEASRAIRKEGCLLITVPFLWPLHDVPYDEYRYTPFSLKKIVEESGFEVVEMEGLGSWHASLASMLALYSRRMLRGWKRNLFSSLLKPVVKYLHKKDNKINKANFNYGHMLTGIWCLARVK